MEWAEQHLPVEKIGTGPAEHLFPAEHGELDRALTFIVQEMRDGELFSERLVASAHLAPVVPDHPSPYHRSAVSASSIARSRGVCSANVSS